MIEPKRLDDVATDGAERVAELRDSEAGREFPHRARAAKRRPLVEQGHGQLWRREHGRGNQTVQAAADDDDVSHSTPGDFVPPDPLAPSLAGAPRPAPLRRVAPEGATSRTCLTL